MKKVALFLLLLLAVSLNLSAQNKFLDLNILGGVGYSIVDVAQGAGWDSAYLEDWSEFHWKVTAQGMYMITDRAAIGAEIGYQSLFYYYFRIPSGGGYYYYRYGTVAPFSISLVAQYYFTPNFYLQGAPGAYIYGDGVAFGLFSAAGYSIMINDTIGIPIGLRIDVIFAQATTIPISFTTGLKIQI